MYGFNPQVNIDRINNQIQELERLKNGYQNIPQQPINNIINTPGQQTPNNNLIEWRILNETEQVDNLYVNNKTLFINDKNMILKGVDGSLEKWEIKKIYPIDEKDQRINQLEEEIKRLKEMIDSEHTKPNKPTRCECESDGDDDELTKSKSKTSTK